MFLCCPALICISVQAIVIIKAIIFQVYCRLFHWSQNSFSVCCVGLLSLTAWRSWSETCCWSYDSQLGPRGLWVQMMRFSAQGNMLLESASRLRTAAVTLGRKFFNTPHLQKEREGEDCIHCQFKVILFISVQTNTHNTLSLTIACVRRAPVLRVGV